MDTQPVEHNDQFNLGIFLAARKELREGVEKAFSNLKSTKKFDRKDVIKLMAELHELVQSLDNLSDIMINDLMIVDKRFQQIEERVLALGQGHTVLRQSLEDKNIVSKDDMQKTWEEKIKPQLEEKIKAAQEATTELESIVEKPDTGLVDQDGLPI
jgi:hypothetical protein